MSVHNKQGLITLTRQVIAKEVQDQSKECIPRENSNHLLMTKAMSTQEK